MKSSTLLPCIEGIHIQSIASSTNSIMLHLSAVARSAYCPLCGHISQRIHSHYSRTLADLPWNRVVVRIHLRARKFYCDNAVCKRRIFTEPLTELAARYARKTNRLQEALYLIGYALGGEAGARVALGLGLTVSPDTLLNRVRQTAATRSANSDGVRVLGVDDWAFRRGQRYGTLLIDLERHCVLDLLPDRSAESLEVWLKERPGIEVISRDRADVYAEGARQGAPHARQIADRFHLAKNLVDTLERFLGRHHRALQEATKSLVDCVVEEAKVPEPPANALMTRVQREKAARWERRQARYEEVRQLRQQGASKRAIAEKLQMSRRTVRHILAEDTLPEPAQRTPRANQLDRYRDYLKKRWEAGCHNAAQLWREIKEQGFTGTQSALRPYVASWRPCPPASLGRKRRQPPNRAPAYPAPTPRRAAWWLLGKSKERNQEQQAFAKAFVERLCDHCPDVKSAQTLALEFCTLLREREWGRLEAWIAKAIESGLAEFGNFAKGLVAGQRGGTGGVDV